MLLGSGILCTGTGALSHMHASLYYLMKQIHSPSTLNFSIASLELNIK